MSTHARRMADPVYGGYVRSIAAQAPPVTDEELRTVRGLIRSGRREAARADAAPVVGKSA